MLNKSNKLLRFNKYYIENYTSSFKNIVINNNDINIFEKEYLDNILFVKKYNIYIGIIKGIMDKYIIVDFGYKFEGTIHISEFKNSKKKKNDVIPVMLVDSDSYIDKCILSYKKALYLLGWLNIEKAYVNKYLLYGIIVTKTKGGFIVNLGRNIFGFLPGSHVDIKTVRDYDIYIGKKMIFQILKINYDNMNIVLSHKVLIKNDKYISKDYILSNIKIGQTIYGEIKSIISYGVFVDLGNIDGLLHITDICWERISHPGVKLKVGEKRKFVVLSIDKEKGRLQLGIKQLFKHPWERLRFRIRSGSIVNGLVKVITDYGAFVEIYPGVEGLVHKSEIFLYNKSINDNSCNNNTCLRVNDRIVCQILDVDFRKYKMSLSIKRLYSDKWYSTCLKYKIRDRCNVIVDSIYSNYIFVNMGSDIIGVLFLFSPYVRDINMNKKFFINDCINLYIISINYEYKFILLSDNLNNYISDLYNKDMYIIGMKYLAEIIYISSNFITVRLIFNNVITLIPIEFFRFKRDIYINKIIICILENINTDYNNLFCVLN